MEKRPQTKVKVVVRLRPTLSPNEKSCVSVVGNRVQILNHRNIGENLQYEFHTVFDNKASQSDVFTTSVEPLMNHVLHGQNVSVFAYGPTGAGKTHTMLGVNSDPGIIPRVIRTLFRAIKQEESSKDGLNYKVSFSYLEIYNEKVHDLLTPSQQDLPIREDASHNIFVADLSEKKIDGFDTFKCHFEPAASNRTVGATKLNKNSSRSHTILMLKVRRQEPSGKEMHGKLYLIDLAGSEDNRRTGNMGIRLKESGAINKSLFVLGEVVDAINNNLSRVPYRNSKLTRLLQDSIGGSCHSVMITNVAPEERFYYDTYCTLNFATKSKKIVNTVTVDVVDPKSNEKPTAAVRPIKRQNETVAGPKLKSSALTAVEAKSRTVSSVDLLPSPLVRQQKAFESAIQEKLKAVTELVEKLQGSTSDSKGPTPQEPPQAPVSPPLPSRRRSTRSLQLSMVSVESEDSPDVICPTPTRKLTDATNLLKQRHFGPPPQRNKKMKLQAKVVDDSTSCSPLFPNKKADKRKSSSDFESPRIKKVKSAAEKFNNPDQAKRNDEFLKLLNSASVKELQQLQTVGVKRAQVIHQWREMHGAFATTHDILSVPGFTEKSLKKLLISNFVTEG